MSTSDPIQPYPTEPGGSPAGPVVPPKPPRNTIGLIGPTRMQYGKVLSVLGEVGRSITELLDGQNESHEKQEEQEK